MSETFPTPWKFQWIDKPRIIAANGAIVCMMSTGTLNGPYSTDDIQEAASRIIAAQNEPVVNKEQAK